MPQSFTKLFILFGLVAYCSSLSSSTVKNFADKNYSSEAEKNNNQIKKLVSFRDLQDYMNSKKTNKNPPDSADKSREKSGSSAQHAPPLKRSDGTLLNAISNTAFQNKLEEFNMSNVPTNYHYPINLMYANNLTVKNYFLMMPNCNVSSDDRTLEQFQSARLEDAGVQKGKTEFTSNPAQTSTESNQPILTTLETTTSGEEFQGETKQSTEILCSGSNCATNPSPALVSVAGNSVSASSELQDKSSSGSVPSTVNFKTESSAQPTTAEEGKTTMNKLLSLISEENNKSEEHKEVAGATVLKQPGISASQSSSNNQLTNDQENNSYSTQSKLSTPATQSQSALQTKSTQSTTLDEKAKNFLQTVDKYCETFFLADKGGTYTINPVTFDMQGRIDPGKTYFVKGNISPLKGKRTLVNKNPRKSVKQIVKSELDYPI